MKYAVYVLCFPLAIVGIAFALWLGSVFVLGNTCSFGTFIFGHFEWTTLSAIGFVAGRGVALIFGVAIVAAFYYEITDRVEEVLDKVKGKRDGH